VEHILAEPEEVNHKECQTPVITNEQGNAQTVNVIELKEPTGIPQFLENVSEDDQMSTTASGPEHPTESGEDTEEVDLEQATSGDLMRDAPRGLPIWTITLGTRQIQQKSRTGPQRTIVSQSTWMDYRKELYAKGKFIKEYDEYVLCDKKKKRKYRNMFRVDGVKVIAAGPFPIEVLVGPTPLRLEAYVTTDCRFTYPFPLGRDAWITIPIKVIYDPTPRHVGTTMECPEAALTRESKINVTCGEKVLLALIDTGAGVKCHFEADI